MIAAALARDTAPWSTSNGDRLTFASQIDGFVVDASGITRLAAAIDGRAPNDFATLIQGITLPSGTNFYLTSNQLAAINGSNLADGSRTVYLAAEDAEGNASSQYVYDFTLDTQPPATLSLDLAASSDTAPLGDGRTAFSTVSLTGQTEPGAVVRLVELDRVVTATNGTFVFANVFLAPGANTFTVIAQDAAGNARQFSRIITRLDGDVTAPTVTAGLQSDTGQSATDRITSNPTIAGAITEPASLDGFRVGFGTTPSTYHDALSFVQPNGAFTLNRSCALNSCSAVRSRTARRQYNSLRKIARGTCRRCSSCRSRSIPHRHMSFPRPAERAQLRRIMPISCLTCRWPVRHLPRRVINCESTAARATVNLCPSHRSKHSICARCGCISRRRLAISITG